MVVWRITGDEIGPNGNGAAYFPTKREATIALRRYGPEGNGPEKIIIKGREALAAELNDAMGFGAS